MTFYESIANQVHRPAVRMFIETSGECAMHPGGGGHSHTLPIRVCAAQQGRDFEAPDLERGIHFRGVFWNGV